MKIEMAIALRCNVATQVETLTLHHEVIDKASKLIASTLNAGKKILTCGNGGSAADAQHLAAEFVGRYMSERDALPAIALTADSAILTAVGNDYGFHNVFSRQVEALGVEGDTLIAITTSGKSVNVITALTAARRKGLNVIVLTSISGQNRVGCIGDNDLCIPVVSSITPRIQECHIFILHLLCEMVDATIKNEVPKVGTMNFPDIFSCNQSGCHFVPIGVSPEGKFYCATHGGANMPNIYSWMRQYGSKFSKKLDSTVLSSQRSNGYSGISSYAATSLSSRRYQLRTEIPECSHC